MDKVQELNVYAILFYNNKILVLRRNSGIWEFPGGGVDWGEHPDTSVVREVKEETSLDLVNPKFIGISSATYAKDGNEKHSIYFVYRGAVNTDKITLCGEHTEYRWLFSEEIKFLKLGLNAESALELLKE